MNKYNENVYKCSKGSTGYCRSGRALDEIDLSLNLRKDKPRDKSKGLNIDSGVVAKTKKPVQMKQKAKRKKSSSENLLDFYEKKQKSGELKNQGDLSFFNYQDKEDK